MFLFISFTIRKQVVLWVFGKDEVVVSTFTKQSERAGSRSDEWFQRGAVIYLRAARLFRPSILYSPKTSMLIKSLRDAIFQKAAFNFRVFSTFFYILKSIAKAG